MKLVLKRRKLTRHAVNFEDPVDLEAVTLSRCGFCRELVAAQTGLSQGQVTYRSTKAKTAEGYPRGIGYVRAYQLGMSPFAKQVLRVALPSMRTETRKTLVKLFSHPTPQTVKEAA